METDTTPDPNPFRRAIKAADGGRNWRKGGKGWSRFDWTRGEVGCGAVLLTVEQVFEKCAVKWDEGYGI